jgi:hypothetical protein
MKVDQIMLGKFPFPSSAKSFETNRRNLKFIRCGSVRKFVTREAIMLKNPLPRTEVGVESEIKKFASIIISFLY